MNRLKGYTLIEILMVILLLAIFTGIVASTYRFFMQEGKSERVSVVREMDLLALQIYLRKLIGSIGFGIPAEQLKVWDNPRCTDGNLTNFKNSNTALGIAKNCPITNVPIHDRLYFRSLYATGAEEAGCWWVIDKTGSKRSMGVNKYGQSCNAINDPVARCVYLDFNRSSNKTVNCNDTLEAGLLFFYNNDSSAPPEVFRLHLASFDSDDIAQRQICAPGTAKLMLQRELNRDSYPLFDCVGGLLFEPMGGTSPTAIRYCMLLQVSGRMTTSREPPSSSTCGSFTKASDEWSYYRWRVIEEVIPLENLKGLVQ